MDVYGCILGRVGPCDMLHSWILCAVYLISRSMIVRLLVNIGICVY